MIERRCGPESPQVAPNPRSLLQARASRPLPDPVPISASVHTTHEPSAKPSTPTHERLRQTEGQSEQMLREDEPASPRAGGQQTGGGGGGGGGGTKAEDYALQKVQITSFIRHILEQYRFGLQILAEFIQNADDAKASEIDIGLDERVHLGSKVLARSLSDTHKNTRTRTTHTYTHMHTHTGTHTQS
jgi:hypothetical protein